MYCFKHLKNPFSSVQLLSHVWLFAIPWTVAHQASLSFNNSQSLLKHIPTDSLTPSNHLIRCCPFLLLTSIFPSIGVYSDESVLHIRWPKCWSFSFSISPSNEYSGLISFRIDWFDLLAVQGLSSLLQHHSSKAYFFSAQLYDPTLISTDDYWKNHSFDCTDLCWQRNVSVFQCAVYVGHSFSSKERLVISWLKSPSAVILETKKIKSFTVSIVSPSICHEWWDQMPWSQFSECSVLSQLFSLSSFTFIKRLFSSSLSAIRVVSSPYLRLLIFLPAILIPACASSSPAFRMMYSVYKLNKLADNIQPWRTAFSILNQFHVQF